MTTKPLARSGSVRPAQIALLLAALVLLFAVPASANASFTFPGNALSVADATGGHTYAPVNAPGKITNVQVRLTSVTHQNVADMDIMLRSPSGKFVTLMSDVCGNNPVLLYSFWFDDAFIDPFTGQASSCSTVQHRPTNLEMLGDTYTHAPGAEPRGHLSWFNGENPSGIWRLFVQDDTANTFGADISSWELVISTDNEGLPRVPTSGTGGAGSGFVLASSQQAGARAIADVDLILNEVTHSFPGDLDIYLQSPAGTAAKVMSDVCSDTRIAGKSFKIDDEAPGPFPTTRSLDCVDLSHFKPTDTSVDAAVPGMPNPDSPTDLSVFDGQFPAGTWHVYVHDDIGGDYGFFGGFDLAITMAGAKTVVAGTPKLRYSKSGRSKIIATGRSALVGPALSTVECAGAAKVQFQAKRVTRKRGKKVTSYKTVASVNAPLNVVDGSCGVAISAKLSKKYSGASMRVVQNFLGTEFIAPFTRTTSTKVKRIRF